MLIDMENNSYIGICEVLLIENQFVLASNNQGAYCGVHYFSIITYFVARKFSCPNNIYLRKFIQTCRKSWIGEHGIIVR